jgi:hypothetical protein
MQRRHLLHGMLGWGALMGTTASWADASGSRLASYYARHQVIVGGAAFAWRDEGPPRRQLGDVRQVGVSQDAYFALRADGALVAWSDEVAGSSQGRSTGPSSGSAAGASPRLALLMQGVAGFAAGQSGWFAIDAAGVLWYRAAAAAGTSTSTSTSPGAAPAPPTRVAENVAAACIGDSADYYIARDGTLFVKGLAHRGQYGDGKLTATAHFVPTARDAIAVKAHTGHAIVLQRDGTVLGTGGNRFGPLSSHGLGDKADRWGPIFEGAVAIATGSRHSAALRADGSLWVWGEGFEIAPKKLFDGVAEVAAGDTATLALTRGGELWQWERGRGRRRVPLPVA